ETLACEVRNSRTDGEAHQHERGDETSERKASVLDLTLAPKLRLNFQVRLKNGLRDRFGLLLFHVPGLPISGLTLKLSRIVQRGGPGGKLYLPPGPARGTMSA